MGPPPTAMAAERASAVAGSGVPLAHLRAELARLARERDALLTELGERDATWQARLSAAEAACEESVHEARAAAGRWSAQIEESTRRCEALEAQREELRAACESLRETAAAAEGGREAHAALLSELQNLAVEQRERERAERAAERVAASSALAESQRRLEESISATEAAEAEAAKAKEAAAKTTAAAEAEATEAAAAIERAVAEAAEAARAREREVEREMAGLRREVAKESVARKSHEREASRLKAEAEAADGARFEQLERKVRAREAQVCGLRQERNALLAALRRQQQLELAPSGAPRGAWAAAKEAGVGEEDEEAMVEEAKVAEAEEEEEEEEDQTDEEEAVVGRGVTILAGRDATTDSVDDAPRTPDLQHRHLPRAGAEGKWATPVLQPTSGDGLPHARRRVVRSELLDELQELTQQLLAPPRAPLLGGLPYEGQDAGQS
jgi:hypothetical protein